ncbi:hypothetical protein DIPPA_16195 [Diplonema papillatum]|nr:hypothetical protein DIPPA_16195 [Diplonema papillatum]
MMRFAMFAAAFAVATADIEASRTIQTVYPGAYGSVNASSGCTTQDKYGSNDCTWAWGSTFNVSGELYSPIDITNTATVSVDLTINGLINFKQECGVCGGTCVIEVPITKQKISIDLPPCPALAAGHYSNMTVVTLPSSSPLPANIKAVGTVSASLTNGTKLFEMSIDVKID